MTDPHRARAPRRSLLFLGGHPAHGLPEHAVRARRAAGSRRSAAAALSWDWLAAAGLLDATVGARLPRRFGEEALDGAAAEARTFREWARSWLMRWRAAPRRDYSSELSALSKVLARESCSSRSGCGWRGTEGDRAAASRAGERAGRAGRRSDRGPRHRGAGSTGAIVCRRGLLAVVPGSRSKSAPAPVWQRRRLRQSREGRRRSGPVHRNHATRVSTRLTLP